MSRPSAKTQKAPRCHAGKTYRELQRANKAAAAEQGLKSQDWRAKGFANRGWLNVIGLYEWLHPLAQPVLDLVSEVVWPERPEAVLPDICPSGIVFERCEETIDLYLDGRIVGSIVPEDDVWLVYNAMASGLLFGSETQQGCVDWVASTDFWSREVMVA